MNRRLLLWSITSALAGFLFGFDTVVISGAEQRIQALWGLSPGIHGVALAAALYGTVFGSLVGAWPADRFGRKPTLLWVGVLYIISAVGSGLAWNVEVFILARLLGGIGIGISTVVAPMYISEIAPLRIVDASRECFSSTSSSASSSPTCPMHCSRVLATTHGGGCSASPRFRRSSIR